MVIPEDVCKRIWGISRIEGPLSYKNKALLVVYYERVQAILDSLGLCLFASNWSSPDLLGPDDLAQLYSAATGNEINEDELMRSGERLHNIEKVFNVLHSGFDRKDDYPPQRFREEPIQSGPLKGERLIEEEWDRLLDEYYGFHKWDVKTGWPTRKCLEDLELKELADDLVKVGRLPS
jgi:aldehyde:ferredoxin oxidoreductase